MLAEEWPGPLWGGQDRWQGAAGKVPLARCRWQGAASEVRQARIGTTEGAAGTAVGWRDHCGWPGPLWSAGTTVVGRDCCGWPGPLWSARIPELAAVGIAGTANRLAKVCQ